MSGPYSRVIEAVAAIAAKLGATVTPTGNRLADNLDGIANVVTPGGGGGGSGVLVVSADMTADTPVLNKTWQEIHDAAQNGVVVLNSLSENGIEPMMLIGVFAIDATKYVVGFFYSGNPDVPERFVSNTADGYPVHVENS